MLKVPISISYTIFFYSNMFFRYDRMIQDIFLGVCSINNITTPNQHQIYFVGKVDGEIAINKHSNAFDICQVEVVLRDLID